MQEHPVLFDDSTGRGYIGVYGRLWEVLCPRVSKELTRPGGILAREPSLQLISIHRLDEAALRQEGRLRVLGMLQGDVTLKAAAQLVLCEQVFRAMYEESLKLPALSSDAGQYGPV